MEIREFAENILFGKEIHSHKLIESAHFTDHAPASRGIIGTSTKPGRPSELRLERWDKWKKISFPNQEELFHDAKNRGIMLHFFANHELLALELMALMLLRFPNAPKNFRRGLVSTMIDEQKHLKIYLEQMQKLGVSFGEIPVNDFFWSTLAECDSLYEFVAGMSLTFEQANLDFALFYLQLMKKIGDVDTLNILETVYRDEIKHVRHGLQWFKMWKPKEMDEWDAYVSALKFPLSPMRAKGNVFYQESRVQAGFSKEFIQRLELHSSSKGRTPNLYYFNPCSETENQFPSASFTHSADVRNLQNDLAMTMLYIAHADDVVAVPEKPSDVFLKDLLELGFEIPEFVLQTKLESLSNRKIHQLKPWGLSPHVIRFFQKANLQISHKYSQDLISEQWDWNHTKRLIDKTFAQDIYHNQILNKLTAAKFKSYCPLIPKEFEAKLCKTEKEFEEAMAFFSSHNFPMLVIKTLFTSSGQGMRVISRSSTGQNYLFSAHDAQWLKLRLADGVLLEPWVNRVADFSYLFKIEDNEIFPLGGTRLLTSKQGQYSGNLLFPLHQDLDESYKPILYHSQGVIETLKSVGVFAGESLKENGYLGAYGIDSYLFADPRDNKIYLRPLCEINARHTMGRIALEIKKHIHPKTFFLWLHLRIPYDLKQLNLKSVEDIRDFLKREFPVKMIPETRLIKEGVFCTNDPSLAKHRLSLAIVGQESYNKWVKTFHSFQL